MPTDHNAQQDAVAGWESEGGAARAQEGGRRSERDRLDASHESDARGEHRYPDTHQTGAEQQARHDRDDLKRDLTGRRRTPPARAD